MNVSTDGETEDRESIYEPKTLSSADKNRLAVAINVAQNSASFERCIALLDHVTQIQQSTAPGRSLSECRRHHIQLLKSMEKTIKLAEDLSDLDAWFVNQYYWLHLVDTDADFFKLAPRGAKSNFLGQFEGMRQGLKRRISNLPAPGKGRQKDHTYTNALTELKSGFELIFPDRAASAEPEALFSKLVVFWMNNYIEINIINPRRHIDNMLAKVKAQTK